jgi:hypothetical protein
MSKEFTAKVVGDRIVIELPIETLVVACEEKPDAGYVVHDKARFAQFIADHLLTFDTESHSDDGLTNFQRMTDELFDEMYILGDAGIHDEADEDDGE